MTHGDIPASGFVGRFLGSWRLALGELVIVSLGVLISMIVSLGIAQLLRGVAQAVHERKQAPIDSVHMVWTAGVFIASPRYQKFLAWYTLLSLSTWSLVVRRFLA